MQTKTVPMMPNEGRGRELARLLQEELGIPETCQWFEIRFAMGECVAVRCEFTPIEPTMDSEVKVANLAYKYHGM